MKPAMVLRLSWSLQRSTDNQTVCRMLVSAGKSNLDWGAPDVAAASDQVVAFWIDMLTDFCP